MSLPTDLDLTEVPRIVHVLCCDDDDNRVEMIETSDDHTFLALSVVSTSPAIDRTAFVFALSPERARAIAAGLMYWAHKHAPTPDLVVDPERRIDDSDDGTGIYVRARLDGKWGSHDIVELTKTSLFNWLRSRGGSNQYAEDVVGILLGHGYLNETPKTKDGAP